MAKRILIFPCGSEIGLEIHRSMRFSTHFELVGASSIDDHGRFVYSEYISGLPFHNEADFVNQIARLVNDRKIDAIYPTMDAVAETLQSASQDINCRVIGSSSWTTAICASKTATYDILRDCLPIPQIHPSLQAVTDFPIFIKPDRGYGSRNTLLANGYDAGHAFLETHHDCKMLLLEHLPGKEWTIDCFSDRHGKLHFHTARSRNRISNGISVNTCPENKFAAEFELWAKAINNTLTPRGAWFFQAKEDANGKPKLLEVAARLGGSSGLFRCMGINFALLSAFDAFDQDVTIAPNRYSIELDRALDNRYKLHLDYQYIYVDLDDCIVIRGRTNIQIIAFLYQAIAEQKKIILLTRHRLDLEASLTKYRISNLFDQIIHLGENEKKSDFIKHEASIFIDDSFSEREDVTRNSGIPTFAPDMVEALLNSPGQN